MKLRGIDSTLTARRTQENAYGTLSGRSFATRESNPLIFLASGFQVALKLTVFDLTERPEPIFIRLADKT